MGNSRVSLCVALGSLALPVLASWDAEAQSNSGAEPAGQGSVKVAQADDQSGSGLQEVVVTAQFRAESLQSTPLAITAISGATLLEKGITDVTGLGQVAPNVSLTSTGAYGGKTVAAFIRGIGAGDYNYNVEPGVAFYVDDVYLGPSYGTMLNLIDLDRVEVLRGPQGTLSGKNAIGGAVHLVTQKPKGDGSGYAQVEGGSYNLLRVRAAYDATLIDNTLFARVSGYSSHRDGYVSLLDFACENPTEVGNTSAPYGLKNSQPRQGCKRGTLGGDDVHAARVQFRWTPVENFEANLSADYVDDDSEGAADVLIGMNPGAFTNFNNNTAIPLYGVPYDTRFLPPNHYSSYATFDDKQHGLSFAPVNSLLTKDITLNTDWTISPNLKLTTISAWRKYLGHWSYDSDSSPLATDSVYDTQQHEQYSEEVRLSGVNFSDRLNWTVGGFYYNAHERDTADVMAALYNYFNSHDDPAKDEAYAAFVHSEFKLTDTLTAIGGLRESRESKDFVFNNQDIPGTGANSFPGGLIKPTSTSFSHMDYRFGLQNQFTATFMAYANVSTGFRSGGFNPKPSTAGQVIPYGPEKLTSYELGTRNEFFDRRVRFNNTIYYGSYKDIQLTARLVDTGTGFPANIVTNAGCGEDLRLRVGAECRCEQPADTDGHGQLYPLQVHEPGARGRVDQRSDAEHDAGSHAEVEVQPGGTAQPPVVRELRQADLQRGLQLAVAAVRRPAQFTAAASAGIRLVEWPPELRNRQELDDFAGWHQHHQQILLLHQELHQRQQPVERSSGRSRGVGPDCSQGLLRRQRAGVKGPLSTWVAAALLLGAATPLTAQEPGQECDRACLNGLVRQYLDGMVAHDVARVPFAQHAKFTENNVPLRFGDGLWGTITKVRPVNISFADPVAGAVGYFGVVEEGGSAALLGLRLQVAGRKITEVETVVARKRASTDQFPDPDGFSNYPDFGRVVAPAHRKTRNELVAVANSYFEGCVEGGGNTGCERQLGTAGFGSVTRIRDRRFPLVDEQRQLVLAASFFDHSGVQRSVTLADGTAARVAKPFDTPYSFVNLELLAVVDGSIKRVAAVVEDVPYSTKTAWSGQFDSSVRSGESACGRACLQGLVDDYMTALLRHDPGRLPWAEHPRFSENNVLLPVGEGLWKTIDEQGPYKLYFADPQTGQIGFYSTVAEDGNASVFSLRLKIEHGHISEAETLVARQIGNSLSRPGDLRDKPVLNAITPVEKRKSREQLIAVANSYFDTLQQNDGTIFAPFHPDCDRVENGVETTNNPALRREITNGSGISIVSMGCTQQFQTGFFRFVTRIRDRRFTLVDEEKSLVFASALFDHTGTLPEVTLTDGHRLPAQFHVPWTWLICELFKVEDGRLRQIEALIVKVPYNTVSQW